MSNPKLRAAACILAASVAANYRDKSHKAQYLYVADALRRSISLAATDKLEAKLARHWQHALACQAVANAFADLDTEFDSAGFLAASCGTSENYFIDSDKEAAS